MRNRVHLGSSREATGIHQLQRMIGNQAVRSLLRSQAAGLQSEPAAPESSHFRYAGGTGGGRSHMQGVATRSALPRVAGSHLLFDATPLLVSSPDSGEEREADARAAHVLRNQSRLEARPRCADDQPLDDGVRHFFEAGFGHDLREVRVHAGPRGATRAAALHARAASSGSHIVFGRGEFAPQTARGLRLLAHELAHVTAPRRHLVERIISRQAEPAQAQTNSINIDRSDPATFGALLQALDDVGQLQFSGRFSLRVRGQNIFVTSEQIVQLRDSATRSIGNAATRVRNSADNDLEAYEGQRRIDEDQYIVSSIVQFVGGVSDPGPTLRAKVSEVRTHEVAVRSALASAQLANALRSLEAAERASREAHRLWRTFFEGIISAGESSVAALTYTRDASFVTLGVLAIIASGGAAATTIAGFEVGTTSTATAISLGAPIVARVGEAGVRAGLGEQVDWTRVALDTAVDLVLVRLGGRLSQGLFQRLGGNPAVRSLGSDLARRVFTSVILQEGNAALRTTIDASYRRLRGQPITWEQFADTLVNQLTDPRGLFIAILMGAVQTAADRRHGTPREFDVRDQAGRPVADVDEMRGGVLFEDKSARNLYVIPPGRTRAQQTEAQWAERQIYDATARRLTGIPASGATTARGRQQGSTRTVPTLAEVQGARRYVFRIELDNPALRAAVSAQLARLRAQFPDWSFDAIYGYRPIPQ